MLVKDINFSRNIQVSRSLLELSGRQLVVFQLKVPQTSFIRQLIFDVAESFTVWILAQVRDFLIAYVRFSMHLVSVWQMGLARLEALLLFVAAQELCFLRQIHASTVLLLLLVAPKV